MKPIEKELSELQEKIDSMKHVERITQDLQELKKKLAWSWVYKVDGELQEKLGGMERMKDRIPIVQAKIDSKKVRELLQHFRYLILQWNLYCSFNNFVIFSKAVHEKRYCTLKCQKNQSSVFQFIFLYAVFASFKNLFLLSIGFFIPLRGF